MGWRIVIIESPCKLTYKNDYMLVRAEKDTMIYIPEIDFLVLSTTQVVITAVLMCELLKNKINIIFCDEKHNPLGSVNLLNGCYNSTKKVLQQIQWSEKQKSIFFTEIIKQKITNQARLLYEEELKTESEMLLNYAAEVQQGDITNREGFAAKVYFNALFGMNFKRGECDGINLALDYGYTVLLGFFNRAVSTNGCLTELGLKHCNEFNKYNFSCDLIEPFRVIIDKFVITNAPPFPLTSEYKHKIISIFSTKIKLEKEYYISDAIAIYVKKTIDALNNKDINALPTYEY